MGHLLRAPVSQSPLTAADRHRLGRGGAGGRGSGLILLTLEALDIVPREDPPAKATGRSYTGQLTCRRAAGAGTWVEDQTP